VLPNSVAVRKETTQGFHHEANGDFKTVAEFNGCGRRKLRMAQEACTEYTYSKTCILFATRH
jgi:hypothetical protein